MHDEVVLGSLPQSLFHGGHRLTFDDLEELLDHAEFALSVDPPLEVLERFERYRQGGDELSRVLSIPLGEATPYMAVFYGIDKGDGVAVRLGYQEFSRGGFG